MKKDVLYYLYPAIISFLTLFVWIYGNKSNMHGEISTLCIILATIIIPIYIIIVNVLAIKDINFIMKIIYSFTSSILNVLIQYFNWGVATGNFFCPDDDTIMIIKYELIISSIILFVYFIITFIVKIIKSLNF